MTSHATDQLDASVIRYLLVYRSRMRMVDLHRAIAEIHDGDQVKFERGEVRSTMKHRFDLLMQVAVEQALRQPQAKILLERKRQHFALDFEDVLRDALYYPTHCWTESKELKISDEDVAEYLSKLHSGAAQDSDKQPDNAPHVNEQSSDNPYNDVMPEIVQIINFVIGWLKDPKSLVEELKSAEKLNMPLEVMEAIPLEPLLDGKQAWRFSSAGLPKPETTRPDTSSSMDRLKAAMTKIADVSEFVLRISDGQVTLGRLADEWRVLRASPAWSQVEQALSRLKATMGRTDVPPKVAIERANSSDIAMVLEYCEMLDERARALQIALLGAMVLGARKSTSNNQHKLTMGLHVLSEGLRLQRRFEPAFTEEFDNILLRLELYIPSVANSLGDRLNTEVLEFLERALADIAGRQPVDEFDKWFQILAWENCRKRWEAAINLLPANVSVSFDELYCEAAEIQPAMSFDIGREKYSVCDHKEEVDLAKWSKAYFDALAMHAPGEPDYCPFWMAAVSLQQLGFGEIVLLLAKTFASSERLPEVDRKQLSPYLGESGSQLLLREIYKVKTGTYPAPDRDVAPDDYKIAVQLEQLVKKLITQLQVNQILAADSKDIRKEKKKGKKEKKEKSEKSVDEKTEVERKLEAEGRKAAHENGLLNSIAIMLTWGSVFHDRASSDDVSHREPVLVIPATKVAALRQWQRPTTTGAIQLPYSRDELQSQAIKLLLSLLPLGTRPLLLVETKAKQPISTYRDVKNLSPLPIDICFLFVQGERRAALPAASTEVDSTLEATIVRARAMVTQYENQRRRIDGILWLPRTISRWIQIAIKQVPHHVVAKVNNLKNRALCVGSGDFLYLWEPRHPVVPAVAGNKIFAVAADPEDRVILGTDCAEPIQVFDRNGRLQSQGGSGQLQNGIVHGIYADGQSFIYVADCKKSRIYRFSSEQTDNISLDSHYLGRKQGTPKKLFHELKEPRDDLSGPTAVAVSLDNQIFVSDGYCNARVHCWKNWHTKEAQMFGKPGSQRGEFQLPSGIAVNSDGEIYVSDRENNRIQIFSANKSFVREIANLDRPCGLCIDGDDNVYVTELGSSKEGGRISIFDAHGTKLASWRRRSKFRSGPAFFPFDIAVNRRRDIFVTAFEASAEDSDASSSIFDKQFNPTTFDGKAALHFYKHIPLK